MWFCRISLICIHWSFSLILKFQVTGLHALIITLKWSHFTWVFLHFLLMIMLIVIDGRLASLIFLRHYFNKGKIKRQSKKIRGKRRKIDSVLTKNLLTGCPSAAAIRTSTPWICANLHSCRHYLWCWITSLEGHNARSNDNKPCKKN